VSVFTNDIVVATMEGFNSSLNAIQNVYQLRNVGGDVSEAEATDDIVEVLDAIYAALGGIMTSGWTLNAYRIVNRTRDTDVGIGIPADDSPGTVGENSAVPQVAYGLTLRTGQLRSRGRKFFAPVLESAVTDNGLISAAALLALADVGDLMTAQQAATNSNWEYGIYSTTLATWLPFNAYTISPTAVTQRRRRQGIGI